MTTKSKKWPFPPIFFCSPLPLKIGLLMTSHHDSHTTTDVKPPKPEMEFHKIKITYAALPMRAQTEKTTFSCKDDCTLTKHKWRWIYSALQYLFYLYSVSLADRLNTASVRPILSYGAQIFDFVFFLGPLSCLATLALWQIFKYSIFLVPPSEGGLG